MIENIEAKLGNMESIGLPNDPVHKLLAMAEMANLCRLKHPSWSFDYDNYNA